LKIVVLGSCKAGPYDIIAVPEKIPNLWNTEEGYKIAFETKFKSAIENADEVWVYAHAIGEHTERDIAYARSLGKKIKLIAEEPHIQYDQEGGILRQ
jgi:hypothetical protein